MRRLGHTVALGARLWGRFQRVQQHRVPPLVRFSVFSFTLGFLHGVGFQQAKEVTGRLVATATHAATFVDAHIAIVGAQVLDDLLERALLQRMAPLSANLRDRLFKGYGPLSSYAGKVDIALALKIISKGDYDALGAINKVRVKFAHSTTFINFLTPEIAALVNAVSGMDDAIPDLKLRYRDRIARMAEVLEGAGDATKPRQSRLRDWRYPSPQKSAE
jgi:hypothetical protein